MIKKYKKRYKKTIKTSLILTMISSGVLVISFLLAHIYWVFGIIAVISLISMLVIPPIGVIIIPKIFQKQLVEELFSQSSKVELTIERCLMWKDIEILSQTDKNIFEISKNSKKRFYLIQKCVEDGYKLMIEDELLTVLQEIYDSRKDSVCDWLIHFDKYYTIKKKMKSKDNKII